MLKIITVIVETLLILMLFACNQPRNMNVKLLERKELKGVPSASGIEKLEDHYWVVGDNSPWLFVLDSSYEITNKVLIHDTSALHSGILDKSRKHDSEAMISFEENGINYLLLIGSGSKETRKKAKLINTKNGELLKEYDLAPFYEMIKEQAKLNEDDLNIEAAALLNGRLYLFNRGENRMISLKLTKFLDFLEERIEEIKVKYITVDLPKLDGIQSGFSGAVADEKYDRIIFTASVENTADWVDDGAVLGSYIGVINVKDIHHHYVPDSFLLEEEGDIMEIKVESIALKKSTTKSINCVLVTDSDGGVSEVLTMELDL